MARQRKQQPDPQTKPHGYSIVERDGKFILMHGGSVRQVFNTRSKAEEYLKLVGV